MIVSTKKILMAVLASGLTFSLSGPLLAADPETKAKRETLRDEIKADKKASREDRKVLVEDKAQLKRDRQALRDAIKRKAPKEEIDQLRAKVKESEKKLAADRKEMKEDRMETRKDRKALRDLKGGN